MADESESNVVSITGAELNAFGEQLHTSQTLQAAIIDLIDHHAVQSGMLYTTVIGILEFCKAEVMARALQNRS